MRHVTKALPLRHRRNGGDSGDVVGLKALKRRPKPKSESVQEKKTLQKGTKAKPRRNSGSLVTETPVCSGGSALRGREIKARGKSGDLDGFCSL